MIFEPLRQASVVSSAGNPLPAAGTCGGSAGGPLRAVAAFSFHAAARAFDRNAHRVSKSNPRHPKASVVMIDHHTGKFGNAKTVFGVA